MNACICIQPGPVIKHEGHCCLSGDIPRAEGYPPAPSCHAGQWRDAYGENHPPQQPELPKEFLDLMEKP